MRKIKKEIKRWAIKNPENGKFFCFSGFNIGASHWEKILDIDTTILIKTKREAEESIQKYELEGNPVCILIVVSEK